MATLKGVDQSLVKRIMDEVLEESPSVKWEDIAGQEVIFINFSVCIDINQGGVSKPFRVS